MTRQNSPDLLIVDHISETIGAKKQDVPVFQSYTLEVRPQALWFGAAAQRLRECVTPASQGAPTSIQCVVTGQLNEHAPAKRVSTAVPDVENESLAVGKHDSNDRGSHARPSARLVHRLKKPAISSLKHCTDVRFAGRSFDKSRDRIDNDLACDIASLMSAHAVGDDSPSMAGGQQAVPVLDRLATAPVAN